MKNIKKISNLFVMVILFSLLGGCASMPGGVAASTTPINGRNYTNLGEVTTGDSSIYLFGILPISDANDTRDAIDAAVRSRRGDAMINVTVDAYTQWWILFTRRVTKINGDVIRFTN